MVPFLPSGAGGGAGGCAPDDGRAGVLGRRGEGRAPPVALSEVSDPALQLRSVRRLEGAGRAEVGLKPLVARADGIGGGGHGAEREKQGDEEGLLHAA